MMFPYCLRYNRLYNPGTRAREAGGRGSKTQGQAEVSAGFPAERRGY